MPQALDVTGRPLEKGDTVTTVSGDVTARVCEIKLDGDTAFARIKPVHRPGSKGIWHAADCLLWLRSERRLASTPARKPGLLVKHGKPGRPRGSRQGK